MKSYQNHGTLRAIEYKKALYLVPEEQADRILKMCLEHPWVPFDETTLHYSSSMIIDSEGQAIKARWTTPATTPATTLEDVSKTTPATTLEDVSKTTPYSAKEIEAVSKALDLPPENLRDLVGMATALAVEPIVLARAIAGFFPEGKAVVTEVEDGTCCRLGCENTETETFHHESYTRACTDHVEELRPWLGEQEEPTGLEDLWRCRSCRCYANVKDLLQPGEVRTKDQSMITIYAPSCPSCFSSDLVDVSEPREISGGITVREIDEEPPKGPWNTVKMTAPQVERRCNCWHAVNRGLFGEEVEHPSGFNCMRCGNTGRIG